MIYCSKCLLPNTRPRISISLKNKICDACNNHLKKKKINWSLRKKTFLDIINKIKKNNKIRYDCLIPVSGGKDSHWQVITCLKYGLKPLCITFAPSSKNSIGESNLQNLIKIGVDHIKLTPNPKIEKKFILESFKKFGSPAVPVHMGMFQQSFLFASLLKIPLIVWGENAAFEYGTNKNDLKGFSLSQKWFKVHGNTFGTFAKYWEKEFPQLKNKLNLYKGTSDKVMKKSGVKGIFLGHYFKYDPNKNFKLAKSYGFLSGKKYRKTGFYSYSDLDDNFISIHHYMKYFKFGFTRTQDNLSIEVRNKRLTRTKAISILNKYGEDKPNKDINLFCKYLGIEVKIFDKIVEKFRNKKIWTKKNNKWKLKNKIN
jgi:N-acetyl sugar amidotransferase|tara:strand:+ start:450 stop:1559 length:1110 start_codon:yes stop_codon:yes gene_type:complete